MFSYPENGINKNSSASSASLHIYNVQTKGTQYMSMVKPVLQAEGYNSWTIHSIVSL